MKLVAVGAGGAQEKVQSQSVGKNSKVKSSSLEVSLDGPSNRNHAIDPMLIEGLVMKTVRKAGFSADEKKFNSLMTNFFREADEEEKRILIRLLRNFVQSD